MSQLTMSITFLPAQPVLQSCVHLASVTPHGNFLYRCLWWVWMWPLRCWWGWSLPAAAAAAREMANGSHPHLSMGSYFPWKQKLLLRCKQPCSYVGKSSVPWMNAQFQWQEPRCPKGGAQGRCSVVIARIPNLKRVLTFCYRNNVWKIKSQETGFIC